MVIRQRRSDSAGAVGSDFGAGGNQRDERNASRSNRGSNAPSSQGNEAPNDRRAEGNGSERSSKSYNSSPELSPKNKSASAVPMDPGDSPSYNGLIHHHQQGKSDVFGCGVCPMGTSTKLAHPLVTLELTARDRARWDADYYKSYGVHDNMEYYGRFYGEYRGEGAGFRGVQGDATNEGDLEWTQGLHQSRYVQRSSYTPQQDVQQQQTHLQQPQLLQQQEQEHQEQENKEQEQRHHRIRQVSDISSLCDSFSGLTIPEGRVFGAGYPLYMDPNLNEPPQCHGLIYSSIPGSIGLTSPAVPLYQHGEPQGRTWIDTLQQAGQHSAAAPWSRCKSNWKTTLPINGIEPNGNFPAPTPSSSPQKHQANEPNLGSKKRVSFSYLQIRTYEMILGDNPSCSGGPSLGLGWRYDPSDFVATVDAYETHRSRLYGTTPNGKPITILPEELVLHQFEREAILLNAGYTRQDLANSVRSMNKIRNRRRRTVHNLPVAFIEERVEVAKRVLKRWILKKEHTRSMYDDWKKRFNE